MWALFGSGPRNISNKLLAPSSASITPLRPAPTGNNILGHATGRLLLKRPGYDIDIDRVIEHARRNGCFFEINSSPDRLDLSADNARVAVQAGVKVAVSTDAHSTREFGLIRYGLDQARRAGLTRDTVLNCLRWEELGRLFKR